VFEKNLTRPSGGEKDPGLELKYPYLIISRYFAGFQLVACGCYSYNFFSATIL
jgi:hypothetical protein